MKISILLKPNGFMKIIPYYTKDLYECNERLFEDGDRHNDPIEKTHYYHAFYRRRYYASFTRRDRELPIYVQPNDDEFISLRDITQVVIWLGDLGVPNV